ncbi:MAG: hypothetical protein R3304_10110 [Longimicrobiales bacterium]|nr:hypothetical protein [Longimicrobiales bacterium]
MIRPALIAVALVLAVSGCYTFRPISSGEMTQGTSVRLRVTGAFSDSVAPLLQRDDALELEGTVVDDGGASFLLDVPVEQAYRGMRLETLRQRIEVPASAVVRMESRQLDRTRTWLAVGAAAVAIGAVVVAELSKDSGGGVPPGGGGGPVDAVISGDLIHSLVRGARLLYR